MELKHRARAVLFLTLHAERSLFEKDSKRKLGIHKIIGNAREKIDHYREAQKIVSKNNWISAHA